MAVSRLLKSWETPPATSARAFIFSIRRRLRSVSASRVTSRTTPTNDLAVPRGSRTGVRVQSSNWVPPMPSGLGRRPCQGASASCRPGAALARGRPWSAAGIWPRIRSRAGLA